MRYSIAFAAAATLLAKDLVLAGKLPGHRKYHDNNRRAEVTLTTEEVVYETEVVYVTVPYDGPATTASVQAFPSADATLRYTNPDGSLVAIPTWPPSSASQVVVATSTQATVASTSAQVTFVSSSAQVSFSSTAALDINVHAAGVRSKAQTTSSASKAAATTLATVYKPSTTEAAKPTATSTSGSSTGGKKGLSYNSAALTLPFLGNKVSWAYNWAATADGLNSAFEYVPMLWGLGSSFTNTWTQSANTALASGSTHLMSFNEPDLAAQSNIGYADAAAGYKQYMMPYAGKAKLGAPAVTNGAAPMGLTYLKNFMSTCTGCQVDFCSVHWYDSASNVAYFKAYMADAHAACNNKPIWITEFAPSGTDAEISTFLGTVLPWMEEEAQSYIERYAYFMASEGVLLSTATALSTIGKAYNA